MPTYIDESGTPDPVPDSNASQFWLTGVWFPSFAEVLAFQEGLADFRQAALKVKKGYVFHFTDLHHERRVRFFEFAVRYSFRFAGCVFDKTRFDPTVLSGMAKRDVFAVVTGGLATAFHPCYLEQEAAAETPLNERVTHDRSDDPLFRATLTTAMLGLRSGRGSGARLVKSVKPGKAAAEAGLQLADMVCGAVRFAYDGKRDYFRLIRHQQVRDGLIAFPETVGGGPSPPPT